MWAYGYKILQSHKNSPLNIRLCFFSRAAEWPYNPGPVPKPSCSPHGSQVTHVDVQPGLHDGYEEVVRSTHIVVHRVTFLSRPLLRIRCGPLLSKVDHLSRTKGEGEKVSAMRRNIARSELLPQTDECEIIKFQAQGRKNMDVLHRAYGGIYATPPLPPLPRLPQRAP